jgi:predicted Zn-dependent protease
MPYKIKLPSLFVLITLSFFTFAELSVAQEQVTAVDKEAAKKLGPMTPEEVKALDKQLAEALTIHYNREFARALPIFKEVATKAETMDIMFWIGTSAMKSGENELAVEKFRKMLSVDPKLSRVSLEFAATYFSMGCYEEARRELEIVKD